VFKLNTRTTSALEAQNGVLGKRLMAHGNFFKFAYHLLKDESKKFLEWRSRQRVDTKWILQTKFALIMFWGQNRRKHKRLMQYLENSYYMFHISFILHIIQRCMSKSVIGYGCFCMEQVRESNKIPSYEKFKIMRNIFFCCTCFPYHSPIFV